MAYRELLEVLQDWKSLLETIWELCVMFFRFVGSLLYSMNTIRLPMR